MKRLAWRLAAKVTKNRDLIKPEERYRVGVIESWTSIAVNTFLTLLKLFFGIVTNSIALIADAVHSASDIFTSLVVLCGFFLAGKKPDREHPHGHGRTEYLAGLIVALMLTGAGAAFVYTAYNRLTGEAFVLPGPASLTAVVVAILIKEFMYNFSANLGKLINSDTLVGDAWHHRSDSLSSGLVIVALIGSYFGFHTLDAYFGIAIALFIIYTGFKIARNSCSRLLGTAPSEKVQQDIACCTKDIEGVISAHDLEVHDYGSWKVVTMHIEVDGDLSLDQAHQIAHRVEEHVSNKYHCNTVVHLDPR